MSIEQERALLPCPFCGGADIEIQISTPDREGVPTNLVCSDCGASGPWEYEQGNSHAKADDAWNRRAALQSQDRQARCRQVPDGWKEAAIAWEVCASIHRKYGKGKDPLFLTRQADFVKHANDARAMLEAAPEVKE